MTLPIYNEEIPLCRRLRTKQAFMHAGTEASWKTGQSATAAYWCLRTMGAHGPDEAYVHPHQCQPGRGCFENSQ